MTSTASLPMETRSVALPRLRGGLLPFVFPFPVHQHIFGIFWAPLAPSRNGREEEVTTVASSFYYWDSFFIGIDIEGLLWIVLSTLPFTKTLGGVFMIYGMTTGLVCSMGTWRWIPPFLLQEGVPYLRVVCLSCLPWEGNFSVRLLWGGCSRFKILVCMCV